MRRITMGKNGFNFLCSSDAIPLVNLQQPEIFKIYSPVHGLEINFAEIR